MSKMNGDQQTPVYYPNQASAAAHQTQPTTFYIPNNEFTPAMRPMSYYPPRPNQPMYSQAIPNGFPQQVFYGGPQYLTPQPFVQAGPRTMAPSNIPVQRVSNETMNGQMNIMIPQGAYVGYTTNLPGTGMYPGGAYVTNPYPVSAPYQPAPAAMANPGGMPPQSPYGLMSNLASSGAPTGANATGNAVPTLLGPSNAQHPTDPSHLSTSQNNSLGSYRTNEKREKKPLIVMDPISHKPIDLINSSSQESSSSSTTTTNVKSSDETNKNPSQTVAKPLDAETTKTNPIPEVEEKTEKIDSEKEKAPTAPSATETENEEEKAEEEEEEKENDKDNEEKSNDVTNSTSEVNSTTQTRAVLSQEESIECVTAPQTPTVPMTKTESKPSSSQRLRYDRDELIRIRDSSTSFPIPQNLPDLDIIINRRDHQRLSYPNYTGTNSHGRFNNRQLSSSSHPSLTRHSIPSNSSSHDSRRGKPNTIYLSTEVDFPNRVADPYRRLDQAKIDANIKVLRDIKAILNKVTPQTYDKLQKQLEALEIDSYERLEGMITIFFSKAVDEPAFSFLYAKLCKQFQKKQVEVRNEDGQTVKHFFRQILLTRCQREFESDYRQEIEYEKRRTDIEAITDEKKKKEEQEKLEEDLVKAKRRKLGNIFFIGELFKLQMLTDTIMYDCIEYLLRDKTDEEALECLCRLLRTIGKELDIKANEKPVNKANLEKHYRELDQIIKEHKVSARIRFMIQDLVELRQASWVARRAEAKPKTIDEIHEEERQKRAQQEREADRERQQRREQNRGTVIGNAYNSGTNPQQYSDGRGSRGSGMKNTNNRNNEDRVENRFNVASLRQLQSNDKRNQGPLAMNLAPQSTWSKGSGIEKKAEDEAQQPNYSRGGKPPAGPVQQLKGKTSVGQGNASYPLQRQSSRELARESSQRDRENALQALRRTTNTSGSGVNSPIHSIGTASMSNSREGSRNVSREQSRNASRESSVSERTSNFGLTARTSKTSALDASTIINPEPTDTSFDEQKTQARVHSLIEEFTENYSDTSTRPVKEALEDLVAFRTSNPDQQTIIVRELFINVLEAKARARKAVGHLLDAAVNEEILSTDAFLAGFKMVVEYAPDYAVDIPLIWQYIAEILGAFIGAPSPNMFLLKPILELVPNDKSKQIFQFIIRFATEFSSQSHLQKLWQLANLSFDDLSKSGLIDSAMENEYQWLTEGADPSVIIQSKETLSPRADPQLVKLFKTFNDQNNPVSDAEILTYIHQHMDPKEKFYIRNIVLSYLEACLIYRDQQKKIQEDIAKKRMTVLNAIIQHKPEAEIQAVYAIQNFVSKLEHPPKMARLLFDIFYDEECVSEDAFFEWLKHPDQSETEGHAVVEMSTKDFFTWLQQAETEVEEGEEETN